MQPTSKEHHQALAIALQKCHPPKSLIPTLSELNDRLVEEFAVSLSPVLSLPVELLEMIFHHTIMDLVNRLYDLTQSAAIFARFCCLFVICRKFKYCLSRARPNIGIHYDTVKLESILPDYTNFYVPVGFCNGADGPANEAPKWHPETWTELFQRFQASRKREDPMDMYRVLRVARSFYGLGRFWLNPYLTFRDLCGVERESRNLVYLILESTIKRDAGPLQDFEKSKRFQSFMEKMVKRDFSHSEVLKVVNTFGDYAFGFSVREWKVEERFELKQSMIAPEVDEWWIFGSYLLEPCIVGYHNEKVWVFDTFNGGVVTNFKPSEKFAGFQGAMAGQTRWFHMYWVSKWPIPHQIYYVTLCI